MTYIMYSVYKVDYRGAAAPKNITLVKMVFYKKILRFFLKARYFLDFSYVEFFWETYFW